MKLAVETKEKHGLVEVRPLKIDRWHEYSGTKDDFAQPKVFRVLYDGSTGGYATGLTPEEEKEYTDKLGLNLSAKFDPSEPHSYWDSKAGSFKLENRPMYFDPKLPLDFIKIKNMKASCLVANSQAEFQQGKWDDATHVIFDEREEVAIKAKKTQIKKECYRISDGLSAEELANVLTVISTDDTIFKGRSQNFLDVELETAIQERPKQFLKYAKMDSAQVYTRSAVLEALQRNILTKEGAAIYYMGEQIGYNVEDAISYFANPQNQKLKVKILEKLTN
jgi:hypothetical protein